MKYAFVNATIIPVDGDIIENGTLIIEDDKIVELGSDLDTSGTEIIDCSDKYITPGLIDAHCHTGVWEEGAGPGPGNNDGNEIFSAITPYTRALDAIHPEDYGFADARFGGVTTIGVTHGSANPIGGQYAVVKTVGSEVDEMVIKEPAGLKMALGENPKRVGEIYKRAPSTRMGVAYLIREAFYDAMDYNNEWQHYYALEELENEKDENDRKPLKAPKYDLGKEILIKVLNREMQVRCHAHRADDIRTAIRLKEEFGYSLIIEHATEGYKIRDTIAEKKIPVAVGPLFGGRFKRELIHQTIANPGMLENAGAEVSIITDSPFNPIHGLRDNVIMAIREGLNESTALKTVTINPARILGVDDRVGSLTPGKDADFLIFDGEPLDARNKVIKTYINGKLVYSREG